MSELNVAVIGGSGFIGTYLCELLSEAGYDFKILDLKKSTMFPEQSTVCDVRNLEQLEKLLKGSDLIINLAAEHKDNVSPVSLYYDVNVEGQKNICAAAKKLEIKNMIFTSSVAVYGFAPNNTDESGAINPFNDYGKSKYEAELVINEWQAETNSNVLILRPTVVFGPRNRGNVFNLFKQIESGRFVMIGNGDNHKSMAYVENITAFIFDMVNKLEGKLIVNYVDKPDLSTKEIVSTVKDAFNRPQSNFSIPYSMGVLAGFAFDILSKITGKEFPISAIRVKKFCSDTQFSSKADALKTFKAPCTLQQGIEKTIKSEFDLKE